MASLTPTQVVAIARRKLLEVSDGVFTDEDILLYANLAKDEVAKRFLSDDRLKTATLAFTGGSATVPTDFETFYQARDSQTPGQGSEFLWVSLEDFRAARHDRMLCRHDGSVLVYPTSTASLYVDYYRKATDMALPSTGTELDAIFMEPIIWGTMFRALEDLQDFELAKVYRDKFEVEFTIRAQAVSQNQEQPQESGAMFNGIDILGGGVGSSDPNRW